MADDQIAELAELLRDNTAAHRLTNVEVLDLITFFLDYGYTLTAPT